MLIAIVGLSLGERMKQEYTVDRTRRATSISTTCRGLLLMMATGCLANATAVGGARAQVEGAAGEAGTCTWGKDREIRGHRFLTPAFVDSALVLSYVGVRAGLEFESIPDVPLPGGNAVDADQIRIAESIDGGIALFDRVGLSITLAGTAGASTNLESLITRGTDYRLIGSLGVLVKLLRVASTSTQISARAFLALETGDVFTLLPLLDAVTDEPVRNAAAVLDSTVDELALTPYSAIRWGAGLVAAQPFTRVFSAQASLRVDVENADLDPFLLDQEARRAIEWTTVTPALGAALTADADPLGVPLAMMIEYRLSLPQTEFDRTGADRSGTSHVAAAGIYYSGRSDLQTGLVLYGVLESDPLIARDPSSSVAAADEPTSKGLRLLLRYFW